MAVEESNNVESDNSLLKKFCTVITKNERSMFKLITEKQTLDWFRRSGKRSEDPPAENIYPTLQQVRAHGVWKTEEADDYIFWTL